ERIWVHVADVSALVKPDSALDQEARARAETLHLPEMHIHLFPQAVTAALGLGLQPVSPAFSFGIDLAPDGSIQTVEVTPSWVRVERVSYAQANQRMAEPALAGLERMADLRRAYRLSHGAIDIDLPEVRVHVDEAGEVFIDPILTLRSRRVVEESMILAGEAAARFAVEHRIPSLYSNQDAPDEVVPHDTLAGMFAMRRFLRRSQVRVQPGPHAGLGLAGYSQATSPLRRALDLTVHQQLRAWLKGEPLQDESRLVERIGMVDAVVPALRKAERDSEKHWTLVYLLRKPGWQGKAVLVNRFGGQATILVPELALEAKLALPAALGLDEELQVACTGIDLPQLEFSLKLSA
ncbi:MAG: RNB domain-containing ribonuclease, partial [Anaerolineae bacterium]|nr:RNB domain-containing ribonuclease [Anaerolineae bacterium]